MYENLSTSVDQFSNDPERWQDLFQEKIDDLAISLYQLTNIQDDNIQECFPMDIESFKEQGDIRRCTAGRRATTKRH